MTEPYLLKYSTSRSISSISVGSRSLGRNTSSIKGEIKKHRVKYCQDKDGETDLQLTRHNITSLTNCIIWLFRLVSVFIFRLSLWLLCLLLWIGSVCCFSVYVMLRPVTPCVRELILSPMCVGSCVMVTVWGSIRGLLARFTLFRSFIYRFLWIPLLLSLLVRFQSSLRPLVCVGRPRFLRFLRLGCIFRAFRTYRLIWSQQFLLPLILLFLSLLRLGCSYTWGLDFGDLIHGIGRKSGAGRSRLWTRGRASLRGAHADELGQARRGMEPLDVLGCSGGILPAVDYIQISLEVLQRERSQVQVYLLQIRWAVEVGQQVVSFERGRLLGEVIDVQVEVVHAEGGTDGVFYGVFDLLQTAGQEAVHPLQLELRPLQKSVRFSVRYGVFYEVGRRCRAGIAVGYIHTTLKSLLLIKRSEEIRHCYVVYRNENG